MNSTDGLSTEKWRDANYPQTTQAMFLPCAICADVMIIQGIQVDIYDLIPIEGITVEQQN